MINRYVGTDFNIRALLSVLKQHRDDEDILIQACSMFESLAEYDFEIELKLMKKRLNCEVVECMSAHPHSAKVQIYALRCLCSLSNCNLHITYLLTCHAHVHAYNAMSFHDENEDIQEYAMKLLWYMSTNEYTCESILDELSVELIFQAKSRFPENENITTAFGRILSNTNNHNSWLYPNLDIMNWIPIVLENSKFGEFTKQTYVKLLADVIDSGYQFKILFRTNILDSCLRVMSLYKENQVIQSEGCDVIHSFVFDGSISPLDLLIADVGDPIVNAMNNHKNQENIQVTGCELLAALIKNQSYLQFFNDIDDLEVAINDAVKNFPNCDVRFGKNPRKLRDLKGVLMNPIRAYQKEMNNWKKQKREQVNKRIDQFEFFQTLNRNCQS